MNKVFQVVFNAYRGLYVATSECTAVRGKKNSKRAALAAATAAALAIFAAPAVNAEAIANQTFEAKTSTTAGGALTIEKDDTNTISNSIFTDNTAVTHGGAVVIKKNTQITGSTFSKNQQTSTDKDTAGGAVYIEGADVTLSGSNLTDNTGFLGGAVNVRTGSTLTVTDSIFSGNHANGFGGAISDYEDKTGAVKNESIAISGSVFENNSDVKGGGALHLVNTKTVTIADSTLRNNYSAGAGGAIFINDISLIATDTVFTGNTSEGFGGAIRAYGYSAPAKVTIIATKDLAITGNKADVNGHLSKNYSDMGGFAYLQGNATLTLAAEGDGTLTIGDASATDKTIDSIASSGSYSAYANELILKGNVVINSSLEAFSDKITVAGSANVKTATGFASDRISLQADINGSPTYAYDDYGTSELILGENATMSMGGLVINRAGWTGTEVAHAYGNPGVSVTAASGSTLNLTSLTVNTKSYLSSGNATDITTTGYGQFNLTGATVNVADGVKLADSATRLGITGSGDFNVKEGLTISGTMTVDGTSESAGLKLSTDSLSIADGGKLTVGDYATLAAPLASVFADNPTFDSTSLTLVSGLTFSKSSSLCITDKGTYKLAFIEVLKTGSGANSVSLPNATLAIEGNQQALADDTTVGALDAKDTALTVEKTLTIQGNSSSTSETPAQTTVKSISLQSSESQLAVTGASNVKVETLESSGGAIAVAGGSTVTATTLETHGNVSVAESSNVEVDKLTASGENTTVTVASDSQLTVKSEMSLGANTTLEVTSAAVSAPTITLGEKATVKVEDATINATTLKGAKDVTITLGSDADDKNAVGTLHADNLSLNGALIFLDPAWKNDAEIADASFMSAASVSDLSGSIAVGQNSVVALGADKAAAVAAYKKLALQNESFRWGSTGITAALYLGQAIDARDSTIVVNGDLTSLSAARDAVSTAESAQANVTIAKNGLLAINQQAVGSKAITGTLTLGDKSYIGLVNATENELTLADEVKVEGTVTVGTDNPFLVGTLSDTKIKTSLSPTSGLAALASTGLQAMTRRADSVLAQTIADRTSVDQDYATGTALWVDVTGERYQADKMDNNASFKSDMGYGAFGGDFAITEDISAGAAIQYGKGTVRSSVSSIKNSIDSYGITAYGSMKFGDAKVVAEASYVKNENDITSSQTALNQSVDTDIYSLGIRGQHRFTAGQFQFVPSVGVRVSRLNTDAMKVGAVNIKKQEQTLVQVPIALRINGFEQNAGGWSVAPSFKIAYVPTFGDKEISVLGADQTVIDTAPVQGDFGIRAQKGNLLINANFMVGGGKDGTSSVGGKAGLKYVF